MVIPFSSVNMGKLKDGNVKLFVVGCFLLDTRVDINARKGLLLIVLNLTK